MSRKKTILSADVPSAEEQVTPPSPATNRLTALHHITALASDPQRNIDFYTRFLGLRLCRATVNFDALNTWHLCYALPRGKTPQPLLTFFCHPETKPGVRGTGQAVAIAFVIAEGAAKFWLHRLASAGIDFLIETRSEKTFLTFSDPDGLPLELVLADTLSSSDAEGSEDIPAEYTLHGLSGVTLSLETVQRTGSLLSRNLGLVLAGEEEGHLCYRTKNGKAEAQLDLLCQPDAPPGMPGAGTVHHIAWHVADAESLKAWRNQLVRLRQNVTPILNRQFYQTIYFREPGGVLFALATDIPVLPEETGLLPGQYLQLPPHLEPMRKQIEQGLPALCLPSPPVAPVECLTELPFIHIFEPAKTKRKKMLALLLLHGMGGNENSLLALGKELLPGAPLLSPRGNVQERSAARFFKTRTSRGFDLKDLARRTEELAGFLRSATQKYALDPALMIAVGYSNGASIAVNLLLTRPECLHAAILFRPVLPALPEIFPDLSGKRIFLAVGHKDRVVSPQETDHLETVLRQTGADVTLFRVEAGHELSQEEIDVAREWLKPCQKSVAVREKKASETVEHVRPLLEKEVCQKEKTVVRKKTTKLVRNL